MQTEDYEGVILQLRGALMFEDNPDERQYLLDAIKALQAEANQRRT